MTIDQAIDMMPPYRHSDTIIVAGDQDVRDIMREVMQAHKEFASDYDRIALYFCGKSVLQICKDLFEFCQTYLPYEAETQDDQTTRSPGGALTMAQMGYASDCKHYAGFIGGVLDAISRNCGYDIDWCYRFASYQVWDATPEHVFIVVHDGDREIWVDPAPIESAMGGVVRSFDDRYTIPSYHRDKRVVGMSSARLSGISIEDYVLEEDACRCGECVGQAGKADNSAAWVIGGLLFLLLIKIVK